MGPLLTLDVETSEAPGKPGSGPATRAGSCDLAPRGQQLGWSIGFTYSCSFPLFRDQKHSLGARSHSSADLVGVVGDADYGVMGLQGLFRE